MRRSTIRFISLVILAFTVAGFMGYQAWRQQGKADDILTMQGIAVCATERDFSSGKHQCPRPERLATTCQEALAAVTAIPNLKLKADLDTVAKNQGEGANCELKTVNKDSRLYAIVIHAYYPVSATAAQPLTGSGVKSEALASLYGTYTNFYESYLALDISTATSTPGLGQTETYQSFSPAFLVKGEPGFKMSVRSVDQNGTVTLNSGARIKISCGNASDIMTAEPNGTSWFSYGGYEKLNCGGNPLVAETVVQKDQNGLWTKGAASYNLAYEPASTALTFQNRPQPENVQFLGKWQGIGVNVTVSATNDDGNETSFPLVGVLVRFKCDTGTSRPLEPSLEQATGAQGRASISLADAQYTMGACPAEAFRATLSRFNSETGTLDKSDPGYDYYFSNSSNVTVGTQSGKELAGGLVAGRQLQIRGTVRLTDVASIPGGILSAGNRICLFYSKDFAATVKGCPDAHTATSTSAQADSNGRYSFGTTAETKLSYGDYKSTGASAMEVRVVNYKGDAYPASVVDGNDTPLDGSSNVKDIHLPSTENDLRDHVCLSVQQTWGSTTGCEPLFNIIFRESRWDVSATNPSSGACGLFQSNPCSKYQGTALSGEPYRVIGNQIRWGVRYIKSRYGTAQEAWKFWQTNNHY